MKASSLGTGVVALVLAACGAGAPADTEVTEEVTEEREAIGSQAGTPYSEAIRVGNAYYFSGKIGRTDETQAMEEGRAAEETRNIMEAFRETFTGLGLDLTDIVSANVYLDDMADYQEMNEAYGAYFPENAPARVTVGVEALPVGAAVEISFVAIGR